MNWNNKRPVLSIRLCFTAPAHEHHVIALHKHGHHLGGLPTFFWATFSLLIICFHLFLFKLIYNEYCGGVQPEIKISRTRSI